LLVRGRPAHEDSERVIGWRTGSGCVGHEEESPVGGECHGFVAEVEVADDGVADDLDAGAVVADVVGCPQGAEGVTAGGKLADEVGEGAVVGARPASARRRATVCWAASAQSR
jgi:hypothetical protein